jgi:hypothetical protein
LVYALDFNVFVTAMVWTTVAVTVAAFLLVIVIVATSVLNLAHRRSAFVVTQRWRSIFEGESLPDHLPFVTRSQAVTVLHLWNDCYVAGARPLLERAARAANFEALALDLVRRRRKDEQLIGLFALGTMRSPAVVPVATKLAGSAPGLLELVAYRALALVDENMVLPFVQKIAQGDDWNLAKVEFVCVEIGVRKLSRALKLVGTNASGTQLERLRPLLRFCQPESNKA